MGGQATSSSRKGFTHTYYLILVTYAQGKRRNGGLVNFSKIFELQL